MNRRRRRKQGKETGRSLSSLQLVVAPLTDNTSLSLSLFLNSEYFKRKNLKRAILYFLHPKLRPAHFCFQARQKKHRKKNLWKLGGYGICLLFFLFFFFFLCCSSFSPVLKLRTGSTWARFRPPRRCFVKWSSGPTGTGSGGSTPFLQVVLGQPPPRAILIGQSQNK